MNKGSYVPMEIDESCTEIGYYCVEVVLLYMAVDMVVQTPSVVSSVAISHTVVMPRDRHILCRDQYCFIGD